MKCQMGLRSLIKNINDNPDKYFTKGIRQDR